MSEEQKRPDPRGVVAIMTSPTGHVIATAADFDRSGYGGFKTWEAQRMRVRDQVKWATVRAYCGEAVVQAIDSYISTQIADALCRNGHRITIRSVGYPDDVAEEIER